MLAGEHVGTSPGLTTSVEVGPAERVVGGAVCWIVAWAGSGACVGVGVACVGSGPGGAVDGAAVAGVRR